MGGLHSAAAFFLKIPELELDETESKNLAASINRVTELYDIPLPDEKIQAWVMLAVTCSSIYGPRLGAVLLKPKQHIKGKVVDMPFAGQAAN